MTEQAGMINAYVCDSQHTVWTRNADSGTTPFIIRCPAPRCGREARSQMYRVPQHLDPTHEWYRPAKTRGLTQAERTHVRLGGLLMRPIRPIPGELGAAFRQQDQS